MIAMDTNRGGSIPDDCRRLNLPRQPILGEWNSVCAPGPAAENPRVLFLTIGLHLIE
jgi:hypothetical protein